jgi:pimeloyl-ACP methyl ester carboxylesterase
MKVKILNGSVGLSGELATPAVPKASVVLIGGSGDSDRDNDGYFVPIREYLVGQGIEVLSYDKRRSWKEGTLQDLAGDALCALRSLPYGRPRGIYGHSEGGWVGLLAAGARDVDFLITSSCPGVSPGVQDRFAVATALRNDPDRGRVLAVFDEILAAAREDASYDAVQALWSDPSLTALTGPVDAALWDFWSRKSRHDPLPGAAAMSCRWLSGYGEADPLVPVEDSMAAFAAAAGTDVTFHLVRAGDHRLRSQPSVGPDPDWLRTMASWITTG